MATQTNSPNILISSGAALEPYRLVTAAGAYTALDTTRDWVGVTQDKAAASGVRIPVRLACAGTCKVTASEAIVAGDLLYKAANGKVSKTATSSIACGRALEAASGDGSVFEAVLYP